MRGKMSHVVWMGVIVVIVVLMIIYFLSNVVQGEQEQYEWDVPGYNQQCATNNDARCRPSITLKNGQVLEVGCETSVQSATDGDPRQVLCRLSSRDKLRNPKIQASDILYDGLAPGEKCKYNQSCANGTCGRKTAADNEPTVCCPSGEVHTYGGYDYCGGMKEHDVCWSDAMCESGLECSGNAGGLQKGTCRKIKRPVNEDCTKNSQCSNGACGRGTADENAGLICCPGGGIVSHAFYDYCTGMPKDSTCWLDSMCAADASNCKGNWDGIYRGKCTPK